MASKKRNKHRISGKHHKQIRLLIEDIKLITELTKHLDKLAKRIWWLAPLIYAALN